MVYNQNNVIMEEEKKDIPVNLTHKPIVYADYEERDKLGGVGDAKWISIGQATWGEEYFSAKIFRQTDDGSWSRQSEELPLWRVLDLAIFTVSFILKQPIKGFEGKIVKGMEAKLAELQDEISDPDIYTFRMEELRSLLGDKKRLRTKRRLKAGFVGTICANIFQKMCGFVTNR